MKIIDIPTYILFLPPSIYIYLCVNFLIFILIFLYYSNTLLKIKFSTNSNLNLIKKTFFGNFNNIKITLTKNIFLLMFFSKQFCFLMADCN